MPTQVGALPGQVTELRQLTGVLTIEGHQPRAVRASGHGNRAGPAPGPGRSTGHQTAREPAGGFPMHGQTSDTRRYRRGHGYPTMITGLDTRMITGAVPVPVTPQHQARPGPGTSNQDIPLPCRGPGGQPSSAVVLLPDSEAGLALGTQSPSLHENGRSGFESQRHPNPGGCSSTGRAPLLLPSEAPLRRALTCFIGGLALLMQHESRRP